jgi:hypothetical protein
VKESAGHPTPCVRARGVLYPLKDTITGEGRPTMAADQAPSHALVLQFVAALLQRTLGCPTVEAHQHALQGFLDDLTPWISPAELRVLPTGVLDFSSWFR